ncbi:low-specificity L-threonine aldolase [Oscillochloris sp. ZM17-4]|uniref:low-specificity L-threonine aldolase n=1 Tax=Oscillochloris sp. ZM17-4 TaxID=2866714 RepID=UPI001C73A682|nr:low-specificity L-threonine aldolase [Oscillochloris sp. ZM17-4]MBX0326717.1 low-specificity L-threonine aldolase [Oscillochloris sp. ZM17-4]
MYEDMAGAAARRGMIDLRSDTVTLPSPAMREAISAAELGDDVYGEDPTVNRLEELAAELIGKEAAVLVPTGTMGNLSAVLAHGGRGDRVILGDECHIYRYEAGGASALGGLIYHALPNGADGTIDLDQLRAAAAASDDPHQSPPGLICLENTHNRCGGVVLPLSYMAAAHAIAQEHGLPLHLDGARVFNAAVALGVDVREITRHVDSVQFCLSKGLSAPVGSMVAGTRPFIARVRRMRKILGGSMRQAGVFAAAGVVALSEMVGRLADDHANARQLAAGLAAIPGLDIDLSRVQTNIVRFELRDERLSVADLTGRLRERGVLVGGMGGQTIRAVTHYGIEAADIDRAVQAVREALAG